MSTTKQTEPTKVLFACRIGAEDWEEQLITEVAERIEQASQWAVSNGFDRLRVATISNERPNFAAAINKR